MTTCIFCNRPIEAHQDFVYLDVGRAAHLLPCRAAHVATGSKIPAADSATKEDQAGGTNAA